MRVHPEPNHLAQSPFGLPALNCGAPTHRNRKRERGRDEESEGEGEKSQRHQEMMEWNSTGAGHTASASLFLPFLAL